MTFAASEDSVTVRESESLLGALLVNTNLKLHTAYAEDSDETTLMQMSFCIFALAQLIMFYYCFNILVFIDVFISYCTMPMLNASVRVIIHER